MIFDRLVGLPYLDKGRDRAGLDCWGLVRLAYLEGLGVELPSYREDYATATDASDIAALVAGELAPWQEIAPGAEAPFDVVLMREGRFPRHVGVVAGLGRMLHIEQGRDSALERYAPLRFRIVGFYRLKSQSEK